MGDSTPVLDQFVEVARERWGTGGLGRVVAAVNTLWRNSADNALLKGFKFSSTHLINGRFLREFSRGVMSFMMAPSDHEYVCALGPAEDGQGADYRYAALYLYMQEKNRLPEGVSLDAFLRAVVVAQKKRIATLEASLKK